MLKMYNFEIVFFMETKLNSRRMKNVCRQCDFLNGIDVAVEGSSEGLNLDWRGDSTITLRSFSKHHIGIEYEGVEGNTKIFTDFYGASDSRNKDDTWNLLKTLGQNHSIFLSL